MSLDPDSLDLLPRASELIDGGALDERFKTELPASHLEIATHFTSSIADLGDQLWDARQLLAGHVAGAARLAAAGVHPFASRSGQLSAGAHYHRLSNEYGAIAQQQLVCGLHVHLGLSGADRVLAVYNEMRGYLPELSALAANGAIYDGRDTGMASMRPIISGMLPRQGVPPPLESWQEFADELAWGRAGHRLARPGEWWWELRPHVQWGTLEVRAPDAQTTVADAVAVCSVVAGVAIWLAKRYDDSGPFPPVPSWRINENRWSAARHGLSGEMVDLRSGELKPTRQRLYQLIEAISPTVSELDGSTHLSRARTLVECNGAERQRRVMADRGAKGLTDWMAERFLQPPD